MHIAEGEVTFRNRFHDNANRENVENFVQRTAAAERLSIDAVNVLGPAGNFTVEIFEGHLDLERSHDRLDVTLAFFLGRKQMVHDAFVFNRIQIFKRQIFQFGLELVQTKTMGERRVDIESFLRDDLSLFGLHVMKRAHVVQTVRDFCHDDARIFCHGVDKLSVRFGFLFDLVALLLGCRNFCHGIDHKCGVFTKTGFDFCKRVRSVFNDIVQKSCKDRRRIELHVRDDFCDFVRVFRVRHAAFAELSLVGFCDKGDSTAELLLVESRIFFHEHVNDVLLRKL